MLGKLSFDPVLICCLCCGCNWIGMIVTSLFLLILLLINIILFFLGLRSCVFTLVVVEVWRG